MRSDILGGLSLMALLCAAGLKCGGESTIQCSVSLLDQIPDTAPAGPWRVVLLSQRTASERKTPRGIGGASPTVTRWKLDASDPVTGDVYVRAAFPERWGQGDTLTLQLGRGNDIVTSIRCPLGRSWVEGTLAGAASGVEWLEIDYSGTGSPVVLPQGVVAAVVDDSASVQDRARLRMLLRWGVRATGRRSWGVGLRRFPLDGDRGSLPCTALTRDDTLTFAVPPKRGWTVLRFSILGMRVVGESVDVRAEASIRGSWQTLGSWRVSGGDADSRVCEVTRTGDWEHIRFTVSGSETVIGLVDPLLISTAPSSRRNLLLVDLDTVRADRLGCYGYRTRPTSQRLDSLLEARGFAVFRRARSAGPHTLPATAKFLTSRYLNIHEGGSVPLEYETLTERLRKEGYYCAAFTGGAILAGHGFEQGFHEYHWTDWYGKVDEIYPEVIRWLQEQRWRPFFLFVHSYEAHGPYTRDLFCRGLPHGRLGDLSEGEPLFPRAPGTAASWRDMSPAESTYAQAAYDGGVRTVSDATVDLLSELDALSLWHNTVVVILSDHGEEFWEHSGIAAHHSPASVYSELLDVPLMIYDPSRPHDSPPSLWHEASTVDLVPTVCDLLSIPLTHPCDGISLRSVMSGSSSVARRVPVLATNAPRTPGVSPRACVYAENLKYIRPLAPSEVGRDPSRAKVGETDPYPVVPQLFDVVNDPREFQDLSDVNRAASQKMAAILDSGLNLATRPATTGGTASQRTPLSEELKRQLRRLGYLDEE